MEKLLLEQNKHSTAQHPPFQGLTPESQSPSDLNEYEATFPGEPSRQRDCEAGRELSLSHLSDVIIIQLPAKFAQREIWDPWDRDLPKALYEDL